MTADNIAIQFYSEETEKGEWSHLLKVSESGSPMQSWVLNPEDLTDLISLPCWNSMCLMGASTFWQNNKPKKKKSTLYSLKHAKHIKKEKKNT